MIIHYNCTIGSFLLHFFLLLYSLHLVRGTFSIEFGSINDDNVPFYVLPFLRTRNS